MLGRWLLAVALGAGTLGAWHRRAEACSCVAPTLVSPAPGSVDVPTNAELFRSSNGPSVVTLVGAGESVEISLQQLTCGGYRYRASLQLEPGTSYEVFQYDPPQLLTSFTTGAGPDSSPPATPSIDALWFGVDDAETHTDCDGRTQVELAVDAPDATTLAVRRETRLGGGCDAIIFPEETDNFGTPFGARCRMFTSLEPGDEYCWEVRARDAAGNESAPASRCATALLCATSDGETLQDCQLPPPSGSGGCTAGRTANSLLAALAAWLLLVVQRRSA